jgi:hypothetical protein
MPGVRIHLTQDPPSRSGLSQWMDSQVETSQGVMLDSLGPVTLAVREILQSEQHTSTLVANTFWQSYVESPAFSRDLAKIGVLPTSVRKHEILVVAHGVYRCSLLLTDDALNSGDVRTLVVNPKGNELAAGWMLAARSQSIAPPRVTASAEFPTLPLLAPSQVLREVVNAQPFSIVVTAPMEEETTSIPSPYASVQCGPHGSTAGAYVQDAMNRIGVTAVEHGVPVGIGVTVDGLPGTVLSRDVLTDSCFIHVSTLLPRRKVSHGPLRLAPRQHEPVTFEGAATPAGASNIVAWNYELPYLDPNLQQTVRTDQVTSQTDSGAALMDGSDYIVGFAHSRSAANAVAAYSSWIWADAVFHRHGLSVY